MTSTTGLARNTNEDNHSASNAHEHSNLDYIFSLKIEATFYKKIF